MVLLTMTPSIVEALQKIEAAKAVRRGQTIDQHGAGEAEISTDDSDSIAEKIETVSSQDFLGKTQNPQRTVAFAEPTLLNAQIGNPISHGQIIAIVGEMKTEGLQPQNLEVLLRGAKVYFAPLPPKAEPTSEYKALMARLRRDEEARLYERITNPPPPMETFNKSFPSSSAAHAFSGLQNISTSDPDDDGLTFADVDKQIALIFNVLLSIVACAAAIWIAARWWSTPARLALSMSGSVLVGVAEVVVYSGYIRRLSEARSKEKAIREVKEIVNTWTVGAGTGEQALEDHDKSVMIGEKDNCTEMKVRKRRLDT